MYSKVLDEKAVAGNIVDKLRDHTNASLSSCVDAAKAVIESLSDFVHEDKFLKIANAIHSYEVNVEDCRDQRLLKRIVEKLREIFREKEELSYSISQSDDQLIEYLKMFSDTVNKTDSRVSYNAVTVDDFAWLNSLINLFQMDQNECISSEVINMLTILTEHCSSLSVFLMETQLLVNIALKIPSPSKPLRRVDIDSLVLFAEIFSLSGAPPLSHFDTITASFVEKLIGHFDSCSEEILNCLVAINDNVPYGMDNPVVLGLRSARIASFGEIFTASTNKHCTKAKLKLLQNIVKDDSLFNNLFYNNDVTVLKHVIGREMINSEYKMMREVCFEIIADLCKSGINCDDLQESIELCDSDAVEKKKLLEMLVESTDSNK